MKIPNKILKELDEIYNFKFVNSIIIFGSYSNNNVNSLSDLDVCVILKQKSSKKEKEIVLNYKSEKLDLNLFDELTLPIQFKVFTEGQVYKTKINLNDIKNQTMNSWFDFRPILNSIYENKGLLPII